ncbi:MAG: GAF domain-containing protein [Deltaproteobacteria bacterium]|nr:GAF domain-containing protein [Deltaproteobacteria bacterium]
MAGNAPSPQNFAEILERGATVDDIFKDQPTPKGSDPYELKKDDPGVKSEETSLSIAPLIVEEASSVTFKTGELAKEMQLSESDLAQVAIIDNDSLFCINRKFAAVEALFRLITRDSLTFGQLISEILRIGMEQVKSEAGSFLEIDYQNGCLFFRAAAGRSSEGLLNFTVPLGQGIAGFVCENQQPMALSSIDDSSVYLSTISNAVGFEAKNMVAYPVVIRGVTFGCLELLNRLGEPQYTDADKEVLVTLCDYAAKVIENRLMLAAISKELHGLKNPGAANKSGEAA